MFSGLFQPMHLILILVIVMIIWGPGKLPEIGAGLAKSIKAFKKTMNEDSPAPTTIEYEEVKKDEGIVHK